MHCLVWVRGRALSGVPGLLQELTPNTEAGCSASALKKPVTLHSSNTPGIERLSEH